MYKTIIFLSIILQFSLNFKVSPSLATVNYILLVNTRVVNTRVQSRVAVRQRPRKDSPVIHWLSNGQRVAVCSQCDHEISFRDSEGNIWWEIKYQDSSGKESRGYAEDKYLLLIDGALCEKDKPRGTQTLAECIGLK